jgi:hypothetical protein
MMSTKYKDRTKFKVVTPGKKEIEIYKSKTLIIKKSLVHRMENRLVLCTRETINIEHA